MALYYKYFFGHETKDQYGQQIVKEIVLYATHETNARRDFEEHYGYPAGVLLRRENW